MNEMNTRYSFNIQWIYKGERQPTITADLPGLPSEWSFQYKIAQDNGLERVDVVVISMTWVDWWDLSAVFDQETES